MDKTLIDEFDDLLEKELVDEDYINASKEYLEQARRQFSDTSRTFQGIKIGDIRKNIFIGKTKLITWDHVCMKIDFENLQPVGKEQTSELIIPSFVEELIPVDSIRNNISRDKIKIVYIPRSVMVIQDECFAYYKNLSKVDIEEDSRLMYIGNRAFMACEKLTKLDLRHCSILDKETINETRIANKHLKITMEGI